MEKEDIIQEEDKVGPIQRYYHESEVARLERHIKRQWITIILLIVALIGMFIYEAQFIDESWSFESTTDGGGAAIANGNGEVNYYGESEGNAPNPNP